MPDPLSNVADANVAEPTDFMPLSEFMAMGDSEPKEVMPLKSFMLGENPLRRNPTYLTAGEPDKFQIRINELEESLNKEGISGFERGLVEFGIKEMQFLRNTSNKIGAFFKENQAERTAKALNVSYMVEKTGLPVQEVEKHIDELMRDPALTGIQPGQLTNEQFTGLVIAPFLGQALLAAPLATSLTVGAFTALDHIVDIEQFVPSDANNQTKTAVELVEFIMLGGAAGAITKVGGKAAGGIMNKFFTKSATKLRLPEKIIVEEKLAKEVFGVEGNEVGIEKFFEVSDTPAFAKLKKALKIPEAAKVFPKDPILKSLTSTEKIVFDGPAIAVRGPIGAGEPSKSILSDQTQGKKADSISLRIRENIQDTSATIEGKVPHTPETPLGRSPKREPILNNKGMASYDKSTTNKAKFEIESELKKPPTTPTGELKSYDGHFELPEATKLQKTRAYIEDYNIRLKVLNDNIAEVSGRALPETLDLWAQKDMLPRVQSDLIRRVRDQKRAMVERIVEDGISLSEVDNFLLASHAIERNAKMKAVRKELKLPELEKPSGMSDATAKGILERAKKNPKLQKYLEIARKESQELIDLEVKHGLISKEDAVRIRKAYKNYVPLFREVDAKGIGIGQGIDIKGKEIKRAKGSLERNLSPLGNIYAQKERVLARIAKNEIGKSLKDLTETYPFLESIFTIEKQKFTPRFNKEGELQFLDPKFKLADNVVGFKIEGKQFFATVHDKRIADALKNVNLARLPNILKYPRAALALWSSMKTRFRPEFLVTNFQRDLGEALINLGVEKAGLSGEAAATLRGDVVKGVFPSQKAVWKYLHGDRKNAVLDEFFKLGGDTGHFWLEGAQKAEVSIYALERRVKNVGGEKFLNPARDALKFVDDVNTMVELGVRFSTYKQLVNRGVSKQSAIQSAADLTVNFSRQGNMSPVLKAGWGFINPAIQGTSKVFRSITSPVGQRNVAKGVAGLTMMGFMTRTISIMFDEEGDRQIPDWTKNHKIAFAAGEGRIVQLWSLPYGYTGFYSLGSNAAEVMFGKKTTGEAVSHIFATTIDSFSPFGTSFNDWQPTLVKPIAEVNANKGWFGGPIRPDQRFTRTPKPNNETYFKHTDASAIFMASALNKISGGSEGKAGFIDVSPNDMQYMFNQYIGGPVEFVMSTTEAAARGTKGEFDPNKTPFVRQFYRKGRPQTFSYGVIFDTLNRAYKKDISQLEKQRFFEAVDVGLQNNVFDEDTGNRYIQGFIKAIYKIEGPIDGETSIETMRQMPENDRTILLKTYKKRTVRKIKNKLRLF